MANKYCNKEECPADDELLESFLVYSSGEDGTMDLSDLHSLFKDSEVELTPFDAKMMFNLIDADTNGKVTFPEFKRMMTKFVTKMTKEDFGKNYFPDLFDASLRTLDADGSGYVSKEELEKLFGEKLKQEVFEVMTTMFLDEDGDGRISIEEAAKIIFNDGGEKLLESKFATIFL